MKKIDYKKVAKHIAGRLSGNYTEHSNYLMTDCPCNHADRRHHHLKITILPDSKFPIRYDCLGRHNKKDVTDAISKLFGKPQQIASLNNFYIDQILPEISAKIELRRTQHENINYTYFDDYEIDPDESFDALAKEYGLTIEDFAQYGCKFIKWFFADNKRQFAIVYPLHNCCNKVKSVARYSKKRLQSHPNKKAGFFPALEQQKNTNNILYLTGGEEKALLLCKYGYFATSNSSGEEISCNQLRYFDDIQHIRIVMDADKSGIDKALKTAQNLRKVNKSVIIEIYHWKKSDKNTDINKYFLQHGHINFDDTRFVSIETFQVLTNEVKEGYKKCKQCNTIKSNDEYYAGKAVCKACKLKTCKKQYKDKKIENKTVVKTCKCCKLRFPENELFWVSSKKVSDKAKRDYPVQICGVDLEKLNSNGFGGGVRISIKNCNGCGKNFLRRKFFEKAEVRCPRCRRADQKRYYLKKKVEKTLNSETS